MSKIFRHQHPATHVRSFLLVTPIVHASDLHCLGSMVFSHFPGASSVSKLNLSILVQSWHCITPSMICVVFEGPDRLSNGQWEDSYSWKLERHSCREVLFQPSIVFPSWTLVARNTLHMSCVPPQCSVHHWLQWCLQCGWVQARTS